jgi:lysophospholipase L1-like esterase
VNVIGDSHAESFVGYPGFKVYPVSMLTAQYLLNDQGKPTSLPCELGKKVLEILKNIPSGEWILFTVGEIDCRAIIYSRYISKKREKGLNDYVDETVNRYIRFLERINDRRIIVLTVVPPGYGDWNGSVSDPKFYAPVKTRAQITRRFNRKLKANCRDRSIHHIDIYKNIVTDTGQTNKEFLRDHIHLNHKGIALIAEELKKKGFIG